MGCTVADVDLPCDWAQFLYVCGERGMEDSALIVIATWCWEGPAMTQQHYMNHGHPDGDIMTSILAHPWFCVTRENSRHYNTDWDIAWEEKLIACSRVGLLRHVTHSIWESVRLLAKTFESDKNAFPQMPKREVFSPGFSILMLHAVWTAFFDRCLIRLPTGEHVSPHYGECPGVGVDSKGFGSSSLAECLERMGDVSGLAAPATCASEGAAEHYRALPATDPYSTYEHRPLSVELLNVSQTFGPST